MRRLLSLLPLGFALLIPGLPAAADQVVIEHHGVIEVDKKPFTGAGEFRFIIRGIRDEILWVQRGDLPKPGQKPTASMKVEVQQGAYQVRLGDPAEDMNPLTTKLLHADPDPHLHVWFNDGTNGFHKVGAYPLEVKPDFNLSEDPVELQRQLVEARKDRKLFGMRMHLAEMNLKRAQKIVDAARALTVGSVPKTTRNADGSRNFQVRMNTRRPEVMGAQDAPIVMMEFTDMQCEICKVFHDTVFPRIKETYIDSGQMVFIHANLPLRMHPQAVPAAQGLICAGEQGRFWPYRDVLFQNQHDLSATALEGYARELDMDMNAFEACQKRANVIIEINNQFKLAHSMGIKATPTFVIGTIEDGNVNGKLIVGHHDYDFFVDAIETTLANIYSANEEGGDGE